MKKNIIIFLISCLCIANTARAEDIGLRYYDGSDIKKIDATSNLFVSPLRVKKGDVVYAISLVTTEDVNFPNIYNCDCSDFGGWSIYTNPGIFEITASDGKWHFYNTGAESGCGYIYGGVPALGDIWTFEINMQFNAVDGGGGYIMQLWGGGGGHDVRWRSDGLYMYHSGEGTLKKVPGVNVEIGSYHTWRFVVDGTNWPSLVDIFKDGVLVVSEFESGFNRNSVGSSQPDGWIQIYNYNALGAYTECYIDYHWATSGLHGYHPQASSIAVKTTNGIKWIKKAE